MNVLMTLTDAMQSAGDMDRESSTILGLCSPAAKTTDHRFHPTYSAYLRRRARVRRAA